MSVDSESIQHAPVSVAGNVAKNFITVSAGNFASQAIGFFVVAYLARVLGPQSYGQVSLATATLAFGAYFADLGLHTLGIRSVAQDRTRLESVVSNYVALKVILAVMATLLVTGFAFVSRLSETVQTLTLLYAITLLFTGVYIDWVFTGLQRMEFIGVARILSYLIYAAIVFLTVHSPQDIFWLPLSVLTGQVVSACFLLFVFKRNYPVFQFKPEPASWVLLLRQALPLSASLLIIQFYISLPPLLLGWFQGETAVGYYSGAWRLEQILHGLLGLFFVTLYPVAAHRWKHSPDTIQPFLEKVLKLILILTIPIAMGGTVMGGQVLTSVLGAKFANSILPFQILLWNLVAVGVNGTFAQLVLMMNGKQKEFLWVVSVGAVVSILMDLLLIPTAGYIGAAVAWVLAEIAVCFSSYWLARRYVTLAFGGVLLRPFAASALMILACWILLVWIAWEVVVPIGGLVYLIGLIAMGGLDRNDWDFARRVLLNERGGESSG